MIGEMASRRKHGREGVDTQASTAEGIKETATALFAERGFAATSVRSIALAAGVTGGAIYNHYKSKEEILNEIVLTNLQELLRDLQRAVGEGEGPTETLDALVRAFAL